MVGIARTRGGDLVTCCLLVAVFVLVLTLLAACAGTTTERAVDEVAAVVPTLVHCDGHFVPENTSAKLLVETMQSLMGTDGPFLGGRLDVVGPSDRPGVCIQTTKPEMVTPTALVAAVTSILRQLDGVRRQRHLRVKLWDVAKGTMAWDRTVPLLVNGDYSALTLGPSVGWTRQPFYIELRIINRDGGDGRKADDLIYAKWLFDGPEKYSPHPSKGGRGVRTTVSCNGEPLLMELTDGENPIFTLLIEASEPTTVPPQL